MSCIRSCIILTSDGWVYYHNTGGIWARLFSFTQYTDPDTSQILTNVKFVSVAIGGYYTCETIFAVTNYGHVFSYGCHNLGLRGTPLSNSEYIPYMIPSLRNITTISSGQRPGNAEVGRTAAGAIDINGVLWTWGSNYYGLLGWNSTVNATSEFPQPVTLLPSKVIRVVFGYGHALVTLDSGDVYGFGDNTYKQSYPDSSITSIYVPTRINITENTTECFAAGYSSACLLNSGYMVSWGYVNFLGHSSTPNYDKVTMVNDAQVIMARISNVHGLTITSDGSVNVWGTSNTASVLTLGEERAIRYPRKLSISSFASGNVTVSKIVGGISCMFVFSKLHNETGNFNALDYWGDCSNSLNFGVPSLTPKSAPQTFVDKDISTIDIRHNTAIAFTNSGEVYGWGLSSAFNGVSSNINSPVLFANDVKKVAVGSANTYVLFNNDTLWGIGANNYYQMGLGSSAPTSTFTSFTQINTTSFLTPDEQIVDIRAGQNNVFLLTDRGNVYGCGRNGGSERFISNSGLENQPTFVRMNGNIKFRKMYIGFYTNLLLISTTGQFYYVYGSPIKPSLPIGDSYVVDICDYSGRFYIISRKGNLYTAGINNAYETNPSQGFSTTISTPALYPRQYFDGIPYLTACSDGRAAIVTREEYTCFGVNSTDPSVCSSHGHCQSPNSCLCDEGYSGLTCSNYTCNSISPSNSTVCSGRGLCIAPETCSNCADSIGTYCQYSKCYGIYANNGLVCSGNGICNGLDKCDCNFGFYGNRCQYRSCFGSPPTSSLSLRTTADVFCTKINKILK
ncbi:ATS1 domain-containing protein [Naegleria gruberi]|uniref:ATS1 domain-containing protein n=1 Tax=Naegleria gruberi TaxID=5762 RepID=D2VN75_NAEGR|nr:ATS1 domain-containing protein [Naegleria gruberi]EFC41693.1 ATS1 domain-containing protein [Naegleria gruberi]|eukprot:XP_002674437.1 ATS1 domain-containing protein [Naegleria gruberi strain NEG-M]